MKRIWDGIPLGVGVDEKPITYNENAPFMIVGPPGSMKTVSIVVNQLLDDTSPRSYIIPDPKLEVAAVTAKFRRSLGHDVRVMNAYGLLVPQRPDLKSDGWNPIDDLQPGTPGYDDECAAKGDALIKTGANESQPIFPNSARSAITGTINFEVRKARAEGRTASLANVLDILTLETEKLIEVVQEMIAMGDPEITTRMRKFLSDNREIQSIKSNIQTDMAWMTQEMRTDMAVSNGVDFSACKKRPTTIYVGVPTKELINKASYSRLWLSSALRALYSEGGVPVTLLVEEAFVLGHLTELENACSILRGYNGRLVTVWQSIAQARKHYPENWGLFMGGGMLAFRPGDMETAKFLVEKTGTHTVPVLSAADPSSRNESEMRPSWQQQKRERIPLAKMFGMPPGRALVWLPGDEAPRVSRMEGYFDIKKLNARASENPYFKARGKRRPRKLLKGVIAAGILAFALARPDLARHVAVQAGSGMLALLHHVERSVAR